MEIFPLAEEALAAVEEEASAALVEAALAVAELEEAGRGSKFQGVTKKHTDPTAVTGGLLCLF